MPLNAINKRNRSIFFITLLLIIKILLPSISFADADKIFKENNKAVVVVVAFDEKNKPISQGSGFIVRSDGAVITNYHVISNAKNIKIKASDKILDVEGFLHIDKENDLVILKAKGKNLPTLKIGDIGKMNIGDKVYVISSPQGLENTISDGILSGVREITPKRKILQITAPVSSGSSGGPVFNKNGEVIGIATFIIKEAQNLNFAMPVNLIKDKIGSKKVTALKDAGIIDYTKTAEYWFTLGYYYHDAGLYDKAIEAYTSAIALDPNDAQVYYNRGRAYSFKKQYDRAIEDYNKAIAINPNHAQVYYMRGIAYDRKEQYDRAKEDYNKAIDINPNYADAYTMRGTAYVGKKQYDRAIEDFNKAIALDPNDAFAYTSRGFAYYRKGQYDRAIEDYNMAIAINPNDAEAYGMRGTAYYRKGQYDRAIEDFNKATAIKPE
ncbi:MAG: tetratricopeptide repeat protein [Nitrospirota bacterium]